MKKLQTILVTAYAVNPYKGSEDGTGWNWILEIARFRNVIAITRKNNRPHIEKYILEHPELFSLTSNIQFAYFDLPYFLRFWKKGPHLSLIYFYMWQFTIPVFIKKNHFQFDIVHNLNFHTDWLPSFLWVFKKPFIWGPVGHHPSVPREFCFIPYGRKEALKNRATWFLKKIFWNLDIFLKLSRNKADYILAVNSDTKKYLGSATPKTLILPAVAAPKYIFEKTRDEIFTVLSVGRFVPLKGFDVTIRSFAKFINNLPIDKRKKTKLILVGTGPLQQYLETLIRDLKIEEYVEMIPWVSQVELFEIYALADVFLFPSHEGAGMVVSEALSFDLPVICFENSGPGELVPKNSQLKVPYQSYSSAINQFAEILNKLSDNEVFFETERALAREHHSTHLTWENKGNILDQLYNSLYRNSYEENLRNSPVERLQRKPVGF